MMFPCLTVFMIIISVFAFLRARSTRSDKERQEAFWNRENEANNTRKADLGDLDYIHPNPGDYTFAAITDKELEPFLQELETLSSLPLLNLNGLSNTDLKLAYGPQNLAELTEYDQNFSRLEQCIAGYGNALTKLGYEDEAIAVLEKGIAYHTDIASNYTLLGSLYKKKNKPAQIKNLIDMTGALNEFARPATVKKLEEMLI